MIGEVFEIDGCFYKEVQSKVHGCSECVFHERCTCFHDKYDSPPIFCSSSTHFVEISKEEYLLFSKDTLVETMKNHQFIVAYDPANNKKDFFVECLWVKKGDSWELDNIKKVN